MGPSATVQPAGTTSSSRPPRSPADRCARDRGARAGAAAPDRRPCRVDHVAARRPPRRSRPARRRSQRPRPSSQLARHLAVDELDRLVLECVPVCRSHARVEGVGDLVERSRARTGDRDLLLVVLHLVAAGDPMLDPISAAAPSAASSARAAPRSSDSNAPRTPPRSTRSERTPMLQLRSTRSGARGSERGARDPGCGGTITRSTPSASATPQAWSGPAPPKATSA